MYVDGSCYHGDRIGGWAFVALDEEGNLFDGSGGEYDTTISRMELTAAIMGLCEIGDRVGPACVEVHSDSEYVVKGVTDRTRARNANQDLWRVLDGVTDDHEFVAYRHVKGHVGHEFNEEADRLAGLARKAQQSVVQV